MFPRGNTRQSGFITSVTAAPARWRQAAVITTLMVWLTILITGLQTWWGREAAERSAYDHILDTSHQLEQAVQRFFSQNRTLARALIYELSQERRSASSPSCPLMCREMLVEMQRRWVELFPGLELLVLDPEGHVAVATEVDTRNRVQGLSELAAYFRDHSDATALVRYARNGRNDHALMASRAHRSPEGKLLAVIVALQPTRLLSEILSAPQLGPGRAVTLADDNGILVARDPVPDLVRFGQQMNPFTGAPRPSSHAGSYHAVSEIDRVDRLWIRRELPYSWAPGKMVLLVGTSTNDYLMSWRQSALLNLFVGITLLIGWTWSLYVFRNFGRSRSQLLATVDLMHKVMESTPVPVVVVSQAERSVVMSNGAMLNLFGALATVGQPMHQIFGDDKVLERLRYSQLSRTEVELVSRKGSIHAEIHGTNLGDLGKPLGRCWLIVLVDVSERIKREQHLQQEATTDVLTGLFNRRHFMSLAEQAFATPRESDQPLSVLAMDLDHFKKVNDEHGHDVGDFVLTTVSNVFKGVLRDSDVAARIGGEEFAALLPRSDSSQAALVGERIRRAIASTPILLPNSRVLTTTVSIGVSAVQPDDLDLTAALKRADKALYLAKKGGRNRVAKDDESEESAA